ncbi:hypothetical protein M413DRAFT_5991 [Hebeloma cylindrosporum]|uniref:Uncharacterized protein n=1 Tax=Hebeloma cylindrosporum TaxID=76867 RepID=A0A0C3CXP2_HEBCY|nr:hypothetical protein M413DRAFT_5991 [Hebeloma cylindrosporum h7]
MVTATPESINTKTNVINFSSSEDSIIAAVRRYSGRAEATCLFKFEIKTGHNKLTILELLCWLQEDSLRRERKCFRPRHKHLKASASPQALRTYPWVDHRGVAKKRKREETKKDLESTQRILDEYHLAARKFDLRILDPEKELAAQERPIQAGSRSTNPQPIQYWQVTINMHGQ